MARMRPTTRADQCPQLGVERTQRTRRLSAVHDPKPSLAEPKSRSGAQSDRPRRISALVGLPEHDPETKSWFAGFERTLERLGWSLGRNASIEYRYAPAATRVQEFAKETVAAQPDVILSYSTPASIALQRETRTSRSSSSGLPTRSDRLSSRVWHGPAAI